MRAALSFVILLLTTTALAGCAQNGPAPGTSGDGDAARESGSYQARGFDGETWPRLDGVTLTILDHGAFAAFDDAKAIFENLTGATVVHLEADDTGSALNRASQEKGDPTFDVVYGVDNILYARAVELGVFEPYKPLLADRIAPQHVFFEGHDDAWHATPVDHGYIAVNWDPRHPALENATIETLDDVRAHAGHFVTQDPRTSTPGLGFLLATIATYGEDGWRDYWRGLFDGGVLVTSGWTEAYENHFSAGYGVHYGGQADKPLVTSYSESPAYEHYFGREEADLARVVTAPRSTFHQIQTMGIAKGTDNLAAAQAWIEFTLTDDFQALAAPGNAVYPVVPTVSVEETYGGVDPTPGSFEPADLAWEEIGRDLETWIAAWVNLCEEHDCA